MTHITHRRLETRVGALEAEPWLAPGPWAAAASGRRTFPFGGFAFGLAALLCVGWWAASPEVLVASERRESGRVLVCKYLDGTRVVEWQFLQPAQATGKQSCALVRFR